MPSHLSSQFYINNRRSLRRLIDKPLPIVIAANGLLQRSGDDTYHFCQDANFWYLTGINEPDLTLVIGETEDYLIVPSRSDSRQTFDGAVSLNDLSNRSGIKNIYLAPEGEAKLKIDLKRVKEAATLARVQPYIEMYGFYTNPARAQNLNQLKLINPRLKIQDITKELASLRVVKQPEEIKVINKAIDITATTLSQIASGSKLEAYDYEYQIEAELSRGFRYLGAGGHAFSPVIASGKRACILHNANNNAKLNRSDLIVIDIGAEVEHYAADITRTLSLSKPTKRQADIHKAVRETQDYAFSLLKPGLMLKDYESKVVHFIGQRLQQLNLISEINHKSVRKFYPHSTSHFLGLNVHDVGDYNLPLRPGNIITVEPGIYIKAEGIGVRIEDDILITSKGYEVLSHQLGKDLKLN